MVYVPFKKDSVQEKILFCQPLPARTKAGQIFKALDDFISRVIFIGADDGAREILFFRCILYLHTSAVLRKKNKYRKKHFPYLMG